MSETSVDCLLVTPVWNDADRLQRFGESLSLALANVDIDVHWIIADDGSDADEKERLCDLVEQFRVVYPKIELARYEERSRKGGAIFNTWATHAGARFVAFVDGDGAIDAAATLGLLQAADRSTNPWASYIAVRDVGGSREVQRSLVRRCSFHSFSFLVRLLTGLRVRDSQCGAKVISGAAFRDVQEELVERGYIFDVELLIALERHGHAIEEISIAWTEVPGSKVSLVRDAWAMVAGLVRIRRRLSGTAN